MMPRSLRSQTAEQTEPIAEPTETIAEPTEVPAEPVATEEAPVSPGEGESTPVVAAATTLPGNDGPDNPGDSLMDHAGVFITGLFLIAVLARVVTVYRTMRRRRATLAGGPSPIPTVSMHGVAD